MTNESTATTTLADVVEKKAKRAAKADKPKATKASKQAKPKAPKAKASKAKASKAKVTKPKAPKAKREPGTESKSVIPLEVAKQYTVHKDAKTPSGNPSIDNGDTVASMLRGQPLDKVYTLVAKKAEVSVGDLQKRYGHLNIGMQRMNLGNKLRGILNAAA